MRSLAFTLLLGLVTVFSSCDKCKDVDCKNGGSCDEGDCECTAFYSGSECENEVRDGYTNLYAGTFNFDGDVDVDTLLIQLDGDNASALKIYDTPLKITLTSSTRFNLSGTEVDGNETYVYSGTGTITGTNMSIDGKVNYNDGVFSDEETFAFTGTRLQ